MMNAIDSEGEIVGQPVMGDQRSQRARLESGDRLKRFRIIRLIGRGGAGEVYLARDLELGRRVALKLVLPAALGESQAVERFRREAQLTARFNHPHIVTIYAVGDWCGRPWVALEYLAGQTLRQRLEQERCAVPEALRIARAVAAALTEAHRHRVLHRDLKPENVLLPADGRLRVVDFGLAKPLEPDPALEAPEPAAAAGPLTTGGMVGTPAYMAPEQWRREPLGPPIDVWALGVMLYELLAGRRPFAAAELTDLAELGERVTAAEPAPRLPPAADQPAGLDELVARCLAKAAAERPAAEELEARLARWLAGDGRRGRPGRQSPFRGLLPFTEGEADRFYGRGEEVAVCLERLRRDPVLPVVGPSGVGKSSFVQAGVIPRLRERGRWRVLGLRPGRDPFQALALRLLRGESGGGIGTPPEGRSRSAAATGDPAELAAELRRRPGRLVLHLLELAEREQAQVLLFVDQLEEVFAQPDDGATREAFLRAVLIAADDAEGPLRVICTLREDFLGRLAAGSGGAAALDRLLVLRPPNDRTLLSILRDTVGGSGCDFEDDLLAEEMVAAVRDEAAGLALLQFAGQQLWERRDRQHQLLTRRAYEEMGGVEGALAQHADAVLTGLSAPRVRLARQICLRLVTPEGTRRSLPRSDLLDGLAADAAGVLDRLIDARLLAAQRRPAASATSDEQEREIELAHESLALVWQRLRRWRAEAREDLRFAAELEQAARLWQGRGQRDAELWDGRALREAQQRAAGLEALPAVARRFLAACQRRQRRRQRRRRWLIGAAMGGLAALAAIALLVAASLEQRRAEAQHQRGLAEQGQAEALLAAARSASERGGVLEARARLRMALERDDSLSSRALWSRLQRQPLVWEAELFHVLGAAWSPTGRTIAIGPGGPLEVLDASTGQALRSLQTAGVYFSTDYSRDGRLLAAAGTVVSVFDEGTGAIVASQPAAKSVFDLCLAGRDRWLAAVVGEDLHVWRLPLEATSRESEGLGHRVACARQRPWLATLDADRRPVLIDASDGRRLALLDGEPVTAVALDAAGARAATGDRRGRIRIYAIEPGTPGGSLRTALEAAPGGLDTAVHELVFAPDGRRLAAGGADGAARVWQVAGGRRLRTFPARASPASGLAFSPSGRQLLVATRDGRIRVWSLQPERMPRAAAGHRGIWLAAAVAPAGDLVASAEVFGDGGIRLWSGPAGTPLGELRGHRGGVADLAFAPDGRLLASASKDGTLRLWSTERRTVSAELHPGAGALAAVAFSPAGHWLAAGGADGRVRLWRLREGRPQAAAQRLVGTGENVLALAFGPDDGLLAASFGGRRLRLWELDAAAGTARPHALAIAGPAPRPHGLAFHPEGRRLYAGGDAGRLLEIDLQRQTSRALAQQDSVLAVSHRAIAVHPAGVLLGAAPGDGLPRRIWDLDRGGTRSVMLNAVGPAAAFAFSADGRYALTEDAAGVRLWHARSGLPHWRSDLLLTGPPRLHTHQGWIAPGSGAPVEPPAGTRWRAALEAGSLVTSLGPQQDTVCRIDPQQALELWQRSTDRLLLRCAEREYIDTIAVAGACVGLFQSSSRWASAVLLRPGRPPRALGAQLIGAARGPAEIYLIGEQRVEALGFGGRPRGSWPVEQVASTALRVPGGLAVGRFNGAVEVLDDAGGAPRRLQNLPGVPVARLLGGPAGTLVVASCDGTVGLWSLATGERLDRIKLHGRPTALVWDGDHLLAATAVGDHAALDYGALRLSHCALLRALWQAVPVTWKSGQPVATAAPAAHHCHRER